MRMFAAKYRLWLPTPEDGWLPLPRGTRVRVLTEQERTNPGYSEPRTMLAWISGWEDTVGWYPLRPDGTDDHETANLFVEKP